MGGGEDGAGAGEGGGDEGGSGKPVVRGSARRKRARTKLANKPMDWQVCSVV